jgi:hypothetical protein
MYEAAAPDLIVFHPALLSDRVRTDCYLRAILNTVKPGDVVLDIKHRPFHSAAFGRGDIAGADRWPVGASVRDALDQLRYGVAARAPRDRAVRPLGSG